MDEISLKGRLELEKSLVGITVCRRNETLRELHALKDPHCFLLQGSVDYLMGILSALPKSKAVQATVLVTKGNRRRLNAFGLKFTKVHHKHVGGALEHCWWVGSAHGVKIPSALVHAQLKDMLKCTETGRVYNGEESTPVRITLDKLESNIVCLSVMVKSGKMLRKLTRAETLDLFDVEVKYQHFISTDFRKQAPGKVAYNLVEAILTSKGLCGSKRKGGDEVEDNPAPKKARLMRMQAEASAQVDGNGSDDGKGNKATKSDDAEVQVELWNKRMFNNCLAVPYDSEKHAKMCNMMRRAMLRFYQRKIYTSFRKYIWQKHGRNVADKYQRCIKQKKRKRLSELEKDVIVGTDALNRASSATYWEWTLGSTLFFWRWPEVYQKQVRDGIAVTLLDKPPVYWKQSRWPEDSAQLEAMRKKI